MTGLRIASIGDNDVDCYEQLGEMYPGGNCLNVSVFARRFGARSDYIGRIGDDAGGVAIRNALAAEQVGTRRLLTVRGSTAWCRIGVSGGERTFLANELGVSRFVPEPDDLAAIAGADAVHVGATSGLDGWVPELSSRARLSYDFAVRRDPEHIAEIAPRAFLSTFSGSELTGEEAERLAARAVLAGSAWVLVTRGSRGAILARGDERWACGATRVEVVDTLGAGDTFLARTLVGLLSGEEPGSAIEAASREAAETCRRFGAFGHAAPLPRDDRGRPTAVRPHHAPHHAQTHAQNGAHP